MYARRVLRRKKIQDIIGFKTNDTGKLYTERVFHEPLFEKTYGQLVVYVRVERNIENRYRNKDGIKRDDSTNLRLNTHNNLQPERLNLRGRDAKDDWPVVGDDVKRTTEEYLIHKLKRIIMRGYEKHNAYSMFDLLIGKPDYTTELGNLYDLCENDLDDIIKEYILEAGGRVDKEEPIDVDKLDNINIEFIQKLFEVIEDRAYEHLKKERSCT